jgi:hypothetical protein
MTLLTNIIKLPRVPNPHRGCWRDVTLKLMGEQESAALITATQTIGDEITSPVAVLIQLFVWRQSLIQLAAERVIPGRSAAWALSDKHQRGLRFPNPRLSP